MTAAPAAGPAFDSQPSPWQTFRLMKYTLLQWLTGLATATVLSQAAETSAPPAAPAAGASPANEVAVIKTSKGEMVAEFWTDVAPGTVENFKKLAGKGFYDGTCFHRIIKGFMIQGGDPLSKDLAATDRWGTGGPGYSIKAEFNDRKHVRGVLSMARSALPDSAGSQFFVCLDPAPSLDRKYTGFGRLIKGEDVLLAIGNTPTKMNRFGNEQSVPTERVEVISIKIVSKDSLK